MEERLINNTTTTDTLRNGSSLQVSFVEIVNLC